MEVFEDEEARRPTHVARHAELGESLSFLLIAVMASPPFVLGDPVCRSNEGTLGANRALVSDLHSEIQTTSGGQLRFEG